jgi:hypothetical protein
MQIQILLVHWKQEAPVFPVWWDGGSAFVVAGTGFGVAHIIMVHAPCHKVLWNFYKINTS